MFQTLQPTPLLGLVLMTSWPVWEPTQWLLQWRIRSMKVSEKFSISGSIEEWQQVKMPLSWLSGLRHLEETGLALVTPTWVLTTKTYWPLLLHMPPLKTGPHTTSLMSIMTPPISTTLSLMPPVLRELVLTSQAIMVQMMMLIFSNTLTTRPPSWSWATIQTVSLPTNIVMSGKPILIHAMTKNKLTILSSPL